MLSYNFFNYQNFSNLDKAFALLPLDGRGGGAGLLPGQIDFLLDFVILEVLVTFERQPNYVPALDVFEFLDLKGNTLILFQNIIKIAFFFEPSQNIMRVIKTTIILKSDLQSLQMLQYFLFHRVDDRWDLMVIQKLNLSFKNTKMLQ